MGDEAPLSLDFRFENWKRYWNFTEGECMRFFRGETVRKNGLAYNIKKLSVDLEPEILKMIDKEFWNLF